MIPVLATLLPVLVGIGIIGYALAQRDTTPESVAYLHDLDSAEPTQDYQAILEKPVAERALDWLRTNLKGRTADTGQLISGYRSTLGRELTLAGLDRTVIPEMMIVAQILGGVVGGALGWLLVEIDAFPAAVSTAAILVLVVVGAFYPRSWLRRKGEARSREIVKDLPDILELTAMGISAGLSIDAAIETVVTAFEGPLAEELQRYLDDETLGSSRKDALDRVRARTDVRQFSQLLSTLSQADEMGMPVTSILKSTANEARQRRRQEAKEQAAKLPVKMLVPLVFCVFPPILVIIMTPAAITIRESLG